MLERPVLHRSMAPRPGVVKAGICGICGQYSLQTRTYPVLNSQGKPQQKLVHKTVLQARSRRRQIARIPVTEADHRLPVRIPMCPACLKDGGRKRSQPRVLSIGITRLDTFSLCPEKYFWEASLPASYEQFRGSLTHAVLAWYTRNGSLSVRDVWNRNGPLGIKAEMLESPRLEKLYRNLLRTVGREKIDEAFLFAIATMETLVQAGVVRTKADWNHSKKHLPLQLDLARPEDPFRVRLSELARYYHYPVPEHWRQHDAVFPGAVDLVAYYEGTNWRRKIDVPDYKTFIPPQEYLAETTYPLQQRLYGLIEGRKFRLPWRNVTRDVSMFLVFAVPGKFEIKPVPFKEGDPQQLLTELYEMTGRLVEARQHQQEAREELANGSIKALAEHFPAQWGTHCDFCPAKAKLCTHWNGPPPSFGELTLVPLEYNDSKKLIPRRD